MISPLQIAQRQSICINLLVQESSGGRKERNIVSRADTDVNLEMGIGGGSCCDVGGGDGERWREDGGGRSKVKDVGRNEEVQELGRFAVEEYKRTLGEEVKGLRFMEVVEAEKQVGCGAEVLLEGGGGDSGWGEAVFDSVVVVNPWEEKSKQLVGFKPSTVTATTALTNMVE